MDIRRQILRQWLSYPLPYLKQGSTLSIVSSRLSGITNVSIQPQWRDDGHVSFQQMQLGKEIGAVATATSRILSSSSSTTDVLVSKHPCKITSLGREQSHISIFLQDSDVRDTEDKSAAEKLTMNTELVPSQDGLVERSDPSRSLGVANLVIDVPEKINIECDLHHGGSIFIDNKIEGDVRLSTANGTIQVKKLRGHSIDLVGSYIVSSNLLESQSLRLTVPATGRIRAKRIHASDMAIEVGTTFTLRHPACMQQHHTDAAEARYDDDDAGAICDISSLYITGEGQIHIDHGQTATSQQHSQRQAVRIKSHHGHIFVQTHDTSIPSTKNPLTQEILPLVDLGGVNGSCEIEITQNPKDMYNDHDVRDAKKFENWTACRVHFDSILPDSVSIISSDWANGNVNVTIDRKVEADVRLLSCPDTMDGMDVETLLLEDDANDETLTDELVHMLRHMDDNNGTTIISPEERIKIKTKAFTARDRFEVSNPPLQHVAFVDGWVENKSSEPDSRFDRKIRGVANTGGSNIGQLGGGKIRQEGAYDQALQGFQKHDSKGTKITSSKASFSRPILAVATAGTIVLETLSWMGNIARRYGLEKDSREARELGRQATRRRRLDDPTE